MKYKHIFFDLDGTLVDSAPDILATIATVLNDAGITPQALTTSLIGPPLEDIFRAVCPHLSPDEIHPLITTYRQMYRASMYPGSNVFTGIVPLLKDICAHEGRVYVATNKPLFVTKRLFDIKGLLPYFTDIICSDSVEGQRISKSRMMQLLLERHQLCREETLMVGDTVLDMLGAKEAGIASLAALYGYGDNEKLLASRPDFVAEDPAWLQLYTWPACKKTVLIY